MKQIKEIRAMIKHGVHDIERRCPRHILDIYSTDITIKASRLCDALEYADRQLAGSPGARAEIERLLEGKK